MRGTSRNRNAASREAPLPVASRLDLPHKGGGASRGVSSTPLSPLVGEIERREAATERGSILPPLVTVTRDGQRRVLAAVDEGAQAIGLRPGQTAAQAQASVPNLDLVEADPEADRAALDRLAAWCLRYAPVIEVDPPDGIWLDIEGAAHLFGGEAQLITDAVLRLRRAGLAVRAALAGTKGAAAALARHAPGTIVPPGEERAAVAPLPVTSLRLEGDTARGLGLLGIASLGDLARLPRPQLALRFGHGLLDRLDRMVGAAAEPLTAIAPPPLPQVRLAFAEPLGALEGLSAALARLAPALCAELARRGLGLRLLDAVFRRVDGRPLAIRVGTAAPARDPAHLLRLLEARLPEIDPGFGIDEIVLSAPRTEPVEGRQASVLDAGAGEGDLAPLVDRLGVRLGEHRVFRAAPVESRVPERSVRRIPALTPPLRHSWPTALPRPSRIVDPPEPVNAIALLPDAPPTFFFWRRTRYIVRAADGPERVRGEWWRTDREVNSLRDYYRVEDSHGHRFWLFRDAPMTENPQWWMHGRFA